MIDKKENIIDRIFPGKGLKQKIKIELKDFLFKADFRKEFFIMGLYSFVLISILIVSGYANDILKEENGKAVAILFVCLGSWFLISDLFKRKKIFSDSLRFIIDSVFFTGFMIPIVVLTGGHDSPLKFTLLFLTSVSSPLYASLVPVFYYLLIIALFNVAISFQAIGWDNHLFFDILESLALLTIGMIINISVTTAKNKAKELKMINEEKIKLNRALDYKNKELTDRVKDKTQELEKALAISQKSVIETSRQRKAIMNILEDVSETQENLKSSKEELENKTIELSKTLEEARANKKELEEQSEAMFNILDDQAETSEVLEKAKTDLEKNQKNLEDIVKLSRDLAKTNDIYEAFKLVGYYLMDVLDCTTVGLYLFDNSQNETHPFYTVCNVENSTKFKNSILENLFAYLKKLNVKYDTDLTSLECQCKVDKIYQENFNQKNSFLMPLEVQDKKLGVVYLYFKKATNKLSEDHKKIVDATLSTLSVSLLGITSAIKTEKSKTNSLLRSLKNGVIMVTTEKDLILTNPAVNKLLSLDNKTLEYKLLIEIFKESKLKEKIEKCLSNGDDEFIENAEYNKKHFEIYVNPVKDNEEKILGASVILHDITQLKLIDQMKTEFVSVASHQLRTPLTAIKLFTEMLYNEQVGKLSDQQKEYLDNVYQSTDRMVRLVNDLLNVTRLESGRLSINPELLNLPTLIEAVITEADPIARTKNCTIQFKKPTKLKKIFLDKNLTRQVLHNFIMNAVRYSPEKKGKIEVEIKEVENKYIEVSVKDNGIGIPKKMQARIFEKFYRADNAVKVATEGTGLGLYVSRMIIETSGGEVWFESVENKGTTFYFKLPIKGMKKKEGEKGLILS